MEHSLQDQDPIKQMHVLWAIRWAIVAWKEVTPKAINNYFVKSTLFGLREGPPPRPCNYIDPVINEVQEMAKQLRAAGRIRELINIQNFIHLPGEDVVDSTEDLIEHVAELYAGPDRDAETDEEDSQQPRIKLNEAIEALQKLRLYEEQQEDSEREVIITLLRQEIGRAHV